MYFFSSFTEGLDLVKEAIARTGYNDKIKIALDVAATEFCIGNYNSFYRNASEQVNVGRKGKWQCLIS